MSATILPFRRPESLLTDEQWARLARRLAISRRELQIVRLLFEDEPEKTIAARLGISLHTVHAHLMHLHWKLGVKSRVGLVLRVFRECLAADVEQDYPVFPRLVSPPSAQEAA